MKLKAILIGLLASVLLVTTGCGSNNTADKTSGSAKTDNTAKTSAQDTKKANEAAIGQLEMDLIPDIHTANEPFKTLISLSGNDKLDKVAVQDASAKAVKSAQDFASKLKNYSLPSGFSEDLKTKVKAALSDLQTAFTKRAEAAKAAGNSNSIDDLKKAVANIDAATKDPYQGFEDKMNAIHKDLGLFKTDYFKELQ